MGKTQTAFIACSRNIWITLQWIDPYGRIVGQAKATSTLPLQHMNVRRRFIPYRVEMQWFGINRHVSFERLGPDFSSDLNIGMFIFLFMAR